MDTGKAKEAKLEGDVDEEEESPGNSSEDSFDWRSRRKTANIIDSVKKRVAMRKSPALEQYVDDAEEGPATSVQPVKSLSLDEKLEELVPEKKTLSLESQKCLSLDRNRTLFRSPPTYNTLECMFGPSVSSTTSAYGAFGSNNSVYSSFRSNDSGMPNLPSRNLSDSAKSSPGFSTSLESDAFEPTANDDSGSKDEVKSDAPERRRKQSQPQKSPTRPPYLKSNSSPSKIINFVQKKMSSGNRSPEEKSSSSDDNKSDGPGKQTRRKLKEAAKNPSYKTISKPPVMSLNLSVDNTKEGDEKAQRETREIAEALMSPTLVKNPFRKRSGATNLSIEDRPRSISAPNSPSFDFQLPEANECCTSEPERD